MKPLTIYQETINLMSEALLARDADLLGSMFDFPYLVSGLQNHMVFRSLDELRPAFEVFFTGFARRGVTHYERVAREAEYVRPDRIVGWHYSHIIANGERLAPPRAAGEVLVRRGDRWLVSESNYPVVAADWPLTEDKIFSDTGFFGKPPGLGGNG
ncbi:MAG: hypothetical protein KDE00_08875 [Rhodobacteraceae bacterium]|nr:hypothetical protein [Paracoccaceae bacterium]